jgi:mono/diheme cytochrome c family protein
MAPVMNRASFTLRSALLLSLTMAACPAGDDGAADSDTGTTSSGTAEETAAVDSTTGADISGEELFLQICAPCHGHDGEGTMLGYALQHPVRDYSTWVVRNGRPGTEFSGSVMAAYAPGTVSDAALEEIWDYLDGFPQPTTGETLYLDYCRNCHGEDASGGVTGVSLHEPEAMAELLEKVREGDDDGPDFSVRTEYMPAFDTTRLTDAEVQLIADHIATL